MSLRFSLELNIRARVKSESTFILSRSLGKFQPGRGKPVVFYNNSFMVHKLPSPQTFTVPESVFITFLWLFHQAKWTLWTLNHECREINLSAIMNSFHMKLCLTNSYMVRHMPVVSTKKFHNKKGGEQRFNYIQAFPGEGKCMQLVRLTATMIVHSPSKLIQSVYTDKWKLQWI